MSFCKTEARQLPCTVARGKTFGTRCCADAASNSPSRSVVRILKLRRHGAQTFQARPVPERFRLALLRYRPLSLPEVIAVSRSAVCGSNGLKKTPRWRSCKPRLRLCGAREGKGVRLSSRSSGGQVQRGQKGRLAHGGYRSTWMHSLRCCPTQGP